MKIFVPAEVDPAEPRTPVTPATIAKLTQLGAQVETQAGLGRGVFFSDAEYQAAGAVVNEDRQGGLATADMVLRLRRPSIEEVACLKPGCIHISYLDPFSEVAIIEALANARISSISMEMIPRSTVAQKMDALSSQASLAGYVAVLLGAQSLNRILPMMTTPCGTIAPAKVLVIGVGVAGLQAIATAKRLGAAVEAFDTRPEVEEQVKSLGARFVKIDLGETGSTAQGYAKELTPAQLDKQRACLAHHSSQADLVITTAQVFGRRAPRIITAGMIQGMKPGSVIVDMAVESGGNVEGSRPGEETRMHDVLILGHTNLPGRVARVASEMYSNNLGNLVEHFWDRERKVFLLDASNEILRHCLITHEGTIRQEVIRGRIETTKTIKAANHP